MSNEGQGNIKQYQENIDSLFRASLGCNLTVDVHKDGYFIRSVMSSLMTGGWCFGGTNPGT